MGIMNISLLVSGLYNRDDRIAYQCLKQLEEASEHSAGVYPFIGDFIDMLGHEHSYIRTRGLILIAANAKWDRDFRIDEIIDRFLKHIQDEKPITARQCIRALPKIAAHKPELKQDIVAALRRADTSVYAESMQPLVQKDIAAALKEIEKIPRS